MLFALAAAVAELAAVAAAVVATIGLANTVLPFASDRNTTGAAATS